MSKTACVILAAGKGTRMKSDLPKVVFELAGKPMINRVIDTAKSIGSEKIILVVGYKKEEVKKVVTEAGIEFAVQEPQLGTGHAVMVCDKNLEDFEGLVYILYGDVPLLKAETLIKMRDKHYKEKSSCTVLTANMEDPLQYGRIVRDEDDNFLKIVEFKDASEKEKMIKEINTGIYCFEACDLKQSLKLLDNNNNQKEYYLTDTLEILRNHGKHISTYILDDLSEASGVNSKEQLKKLEEDFLGN